MGLTEGDTHGYLESSYETSSGVCSSVWSPIASSTSINKLQVMQYAALRTATGCTQDTHIQHLHDETLTLPIHEHLHTYIHIHTSIVSKHLATRGNNKILRTSPPHINSSEERLPCLTRRTLAKLRTNKFPFLNHTYAKSTPVHIHHHYAPSVTSTHTAHIISSTEPTYAPHCHPWICGQTPPGDCTAGQMDGEAGWWTTIGNIGLPPTSKGHGRGRQQQDYQRRFTENPFSEDIVNLKMHYSMRPQNHNVASSRT